MIDLPLSTTSLTASNGAESVTVLSIKGRNITWQYEGVNDSGGNSALLPELEEGEEYTEADVVAAVVASDEGLTV